MGSLLTAAARQLWQAPDGSLVYELTVSARTALSVCDLDVVEMTDGMPARVRVTRGVPEEAAEGADGVQRGVA